MHDILSKLFDIKNKVRKFEAIYKSSGGKN